MTNPIFNSYLELLSQQDIAETTSKDKLVDHEDQFFQAYCRLIPLNAWRVYLLPTQMSEVALAFFAEAQNDGLVSLLLARKGMWRPSLQCLRSAIENLMSSLYFRDHPVEYALWESGRFRIGFTDLKQYFENHPATGAVANSMNGIEILEKQYRILSKAVHGSGIDFRMTNGTDIPIVYGHQKSAFGKWNANQKEVLMGLNLLLVCFFRVQIAGTAYSNIRSSLSYAISNSIRKKLQTEWGVIVPTSA